MYCIPATGRIPSIVTKIKENLDDEQKNSQEEKQKKKPKKKSKKYLQKMVKHCFFPICNPNYDGSKIGKKAPIFRLPKNEEECARWIKAIPLKKTINSKNSFICERHWPTGYAKISKKGKERPRDPPTVWPNHPRRCAS